MTLLIACGDRRPKGDGPYADLVADAVPKIEKQLGLTFKTPPKLETRSKDKVAEFVMKQLTSDRAKSQIDGQQSAYRVLGLMPDTMDLGALLQRLLEEQIIGYYDPTTKVLYVVEGAPKALLPQTVTHELVHALQDQYVNIDSIQALGDNADRQGSAQAVLEGQAVFTQLLADPNAGPMLKMPGGWDRIRDMIRDGQSGMPVFCVRAAGGARRPAVPVSRRRRLRAALHREAADQRVADRPAGVLAADPQRRGLLHR